MKTESFWKIVELVLTVLTTVVTIVKRAFPDPAPEDNE